MNWKLLCGRSSFIRSVHPGFWHYRHLLHGPMASIEAPTGVLLLSKSFAIVGASADIAE